MDPTSGEVLATFVAETGRIQRNISVVTRTAAELAENFYIARCQAIVPVSCESSPSAVQSQISELIKRVCILNFIYQIIT